MVAVTRTLFLALLTIPTVGFAADLAAGKEAFGPCVSCHGEQGEGRRVVDAPAVGGCTIYSCGDARKLRDPTTAVVVRVHDECIGSDALGGMWGASHRGAV